MQSFSYKVKSELCRTAVSRLCCARAEAYGVLLYCNTFTPTLVRIITENAEFAARLPRLFQRAFSVKFDRLPEDDGGHGKLVFQITHPEKLDRIINQLGYDPRQTMVLHVNFALLEDECCRTAFLRGAFLAGGSVTDPEKRYHLELTGSHAQASREMSALLTEMGFLPRSVRRGGATVIYFKQSEHIEDLLTTIGAPASAMDVMTAKVDKSIRNGANRAMNCDMANVNKTLDAAEEQLTAIERLRGGSAWESLPEKLRQTAQLRLAYPELSACAACEALRSAGDKIMHEPQNEKAWRKRGNRNDERRTLPRGEGIPREGTQLRAVSAGHFPRRGGADGAAGAWPWGRAWRRCALRRHLRRGERAGAHPRRVLSGSVRPTAHDEADKGVREPLCRAFPPARLPRSLLPAQDLEPSELAQELAAGDHCGLLIVTAAGILSDMLGETA